MAKEASAEQALALANQEYCRCKGLLEHTRQHLDETCKKSVDDRKLDMLEVVHLSYYRDSLKDKINHQEKVVNEVSLVMENKRHEAVQARQERQVMEKIREVRFQEYRREELSREQKEADELALYAHQRRMKVSASLLLNTLLTV